MKFTEIKNRFVEIGNMQTSEVLRVSYKRFSDEVKTRPRIKLVAMVLIVLLASFIVSAKSSTYLKAKEADIKVNGQPVIAANAPSKIEPTPPPRISQAVSFKRSPFELQYPVAGAVSQGYSFFHRAFDIATAFGTSIKPVGPGVIEFAGRYTDGRGNVVIVNHGDGFKSLYAHMGQIYVGVGNEVTTSTALGTVGLTGRTTGPHVHLEIYENDKVVNPDGVLPK